MAAAVTAPGWRTVKLGDILTLHYGKPLADSDRSPAGKFPVYGANGIKDRTDKSLCNEPALIVGRKGSAGEVTRADGPSWPLDVTYYTSHDADRLDFYYMDYALSMLDLPSLARGVKPGINRNDVYALNVPLPPLDEQKRIVAVLDQAFAALDRARANIEVNMEMSRRLFEASLETTFSGIGAEFGSKPVAALCTSIIDCVNKTAPKIDTCTPFMMVRTSNVRHGRLDLSDVKYVSEDTYLQWTRRQTPAIGDVLLTREAPLGEAAIVDTSEKIFLGQRIVSYRTNPEVLLARYLLLAFRSPLLKKQFEHLGAGATVQHMRVPQSKELKIPLASMSHQQKVVSRLTSMEHKADQLEHLYSKQLTDLRNLRQSLLQKAFSGQLT